MKSLFTKTCLRTAGLILCIGILSSLSTGGCMDNTKNAGSSGKGPIVATLPATILGGNSVTLNGTINPNGNDLTWWFQYADQGTPYNLSSNSASLSGNLGETSVSATLTNLSNIHSYHYRTVAQYSGGVAYGGDQVFHP